MFYILFASLGLIATAGNISVSGQQLDIDSCRPDGNFYRCLVGDRPVFLTPDEYSMVRQAIAAGAVVTPNARASGASPDNHREPDRQAPSTNVQTNLAELSSALDSIIQADASGWMFNRYDRGSVRNVRILERSADGRSMVVYGDYTFNGGRSGNVRVLITDGNVECLRFWDSPSCRPLGRSHSQALVAAAIVGAASSDGGSSGGTQQNCQLERIGGQVQRICY